MVALRVGVEAPAADLDIDAIAMAAILGDVGVSFVSNERLVYINIFVYASRLHGKVRAKG